MMRFRSLGGAMPTACHHPRALRSNHSASRYGRRAPYPRRKARGFTMIEVMVAVAILAMISTLIFTSFSSLKLSRDGIRRVTERHREGRIALSRVSRELQSSYISKNLPFDLSQAVSQTVFIGEQGSPADRIDFNAFVNRRIDRDSHTSDQAEVSYYGLPRPTGDGEIDLVRRIDNSLDLEPQEGGRVQVLASDIDLFDLRYLDPLTGLWTEQWDSTEAIRQLDRLPMQIHVTLVLNGGARISADEAHDTLAFTTKIGLSQREPIFFGRR